MPASKTTEISRQCSHCDIVKLHEDFYKNKRQCGGISHYCKSCWKEYWSQRPKEDISRYGKTYHTKMKNDEKYRTRRRNNDHKKYLQLRADALFYYSPNKQPECACCGELNTAFLTIDHINNNGAEHRKQDPQANRLARWVKTHNYPPGFQILCFNCNWAKAHGGCPHKD